MKEIQKKHFLRGRFRTITTEGRGYILLQGNDGGILGYIVPAEHMMEPDYMAGLRSAIEELPRLKKSENVANKGMCRGLQSSRCYCVWYAYGKEPIRSSNYTKDGESAQRFVEQIKPLWEKASEILRQVFPRIHSIYMPIV